jgi:hypothetical protein
MVFLDLGLDQRLLQEVEFGVAGLGNTDWKEEKMGG